MELRPSTSATKLDTAGHSADLLPAPAPRAAPPSSVSVQVGRLALDGFNLPPGGARHVQAAFQAELARLLAAGELPAGLLSGGWRRALPGAPLSITEWADSADLGRRIARAIYEGIGR